MRISDWSSDVCSSDLLGGRRFDRPGRAATAFGALGVAAAGGRGLRIMGDAVGILPLVKILGAGGAGGEQQGQADQGGQRVAGHGGILRERSEEHTSELQSLMRISYAVFCLKKKNK